MIPATLAFVSRWLLNATGAGLAAAWFTAVLLIWGAVWFLVTVAAKLPGWWRDALSQLTRWHVAQIRRANTQIRYEDRGVESSGWWAIGTTVALVAIWGAVYWGTR